MSLNQVTYVSWSLNKTNLWIRWFFFKIVIFLFLTFWFFKLLLLLNLCLYYNNFAKQTFWNMKKTMTQFFPLTSSSIHFFCFNLCSKNIIRFCIRIYNLLSIFIRVLSLLRWNVTFSHWFKVSVVWSTKGKTNIVELDVVLVDPFNIFIDIQYHPVKVVGDVAALQLSNVNLRKFIKKPNFYLFKRNDKCLFN
jgi:hypothetical protein